MRHALMTFFAVLATLQVHAITATKEYVDKKDAVTYTNAVNAAKTYTDQAVQQAGSVTPTIVTNIAGAATSNIVTKSFVESLGIESGVTSVNGSTGAVIVTAQSIGAYTSAQTDAKLSEKLDSTAVVGWGVKCVRGTSTNDLIKYSGGISVGDNASANSLDASAFGSRAIASGGYSTAIGYVSKAKATGAVAVGESEARGIYSTAVGDGCISAAESALSIGNMASARAEYSVSIGNNNNVISSASNSVAIGNNVRVESPNAISIGNREESSIVPCDNGPGSVNFYPVNGITNFWIGSKNMLQHILENGTPSDYSTVRSNASAVTVLQGQVTAIGAHLNAEDARFVTTNYNSATRMPESYVEIKLPDQTWSVIWKEMTRWNWLIDDYLPTNFYTKGQVNAALDQKADRAWGYYDSTTGAYAPDGFTWISSPKIAIAANMGYQRTITAEGAIWVLESNGLVTETGGVQSNGFFRISDDEGNVHFEIVKGNKRTIGADASSCQTVAGFSPTKLQIGYSVVADAHPTLYICNNLSSHNWKAETDADCLANVTWEGTSGAYVAYLQGKTAQSSLFVKATYQTGAETYIRNASPVSMDYMYLGGVKYAVGTATISGNTVLTLTPAP